MDAIAKFLHLSSITFNQLTTLVAQILAGLLACAAAIINGGILAVPLAVAVLGLTVTLTIDKINKYRFENETLAKLNRIYMQRNDLEYIGGIREGANEAMLKCRHAIFVKNTLFDRTAPNNATSLGEILPASVRSFVTSIADGCNWTDVFKSEEEPSVRKNIEELNQADVKGSYKAIRIDSNLPLLQVMLIKISDTDRTVLVGWTLGRAEYARVYRSTDSETFRYFDDYFENIVANCEIDRQNRLIRPTGPRTSPLGGHPEARLG